MVFKPYYLLPLLLIATMTGCGGSCAKGDAGPMGPSGSNGNNGQNPYPIATTYLYNNNFDSAANVNEWVGYVNAGGAVAAALTTTVFLSSPHSMSVNLGGGDGSNVAMSLNYSGSGNLIFDSYQNFSGFSTSSQQGELVLFFGGKRHMTVGVLQTGTSTTNLYSYNGAAQVTLYTAIPGGLWHHMTEIWHQNADTSDYYVDGNLVGQNFASSTLTWNTTSYPHEVAFYEPAGAGFGETWYVDNLTIGQ
jgi:hypothetical protein